MSEYKDIAILMNQWNEKFITQTKFILSDNNKFSENIKRMTKTFLTKKELEQLIVDNHESVY
jgi:hypothetical protein